MRDHVLAGQRLLVIEDDYLLMDELRGELIAAGAEVVGPVGTVEGALKLLSAAPPIDAALVDVNLRGEMAFSAVDILIARAISVVFVTGYDAEALPARFTAVPRCEKPVAMDALERALLTLRGDDAARATA